MLFLVIEPYKGAAIDLRIIAAWAKGTRFGRPPMERDPKFEELKKQWESGQISLREGGRQLGVTHKTFQKWVTEENIDKR